MNTFLLAVKGGEKRWRMTKVIKAVGYLHLFDLWSLPSEKTHERIGNRFPYTIYRFTLRFPTAPSSWRLISWQVGPLLSTRSIQLSDGFSEPSE